MAKLVFGMNQERSPNRRKARPWSLDFAGRKPNPKKFN